MSINAAFGGCGYITKKQKGKDFRSQVFVAEDTEDLGVGKSGISGVGCTEKKNSASGKQLNRNYLGKISRRKEDGPRGLAHPGLNFSDIGSSMNAGAGITSSTFLSALTFPQSTGFFCPWSFFF